MVKVKVICKLRDLMESNGLNQTELAEKTGLASTTIGRLYRNQASRVDFSTLETLANYFGLENINDLLQLEVSRSD